jgi:membrane protein implicated in regulation of membrane protease activity
MLVVTAVALLMLDAVLLVLAGWWVERPSLMWGGAFSAVLALGVAWSWRHHVRRLARIDDARRELRRDVEDLARVTRDRS